jgi:hypothetical protein
MVSVMNRLGELGWAPPCQWVSRGQIGWTYVENVFELSPLLWWAWLKMHTTGTFTEVDRKVHKRHNRRRIESSSSASLVNIKFQLTKTKRSFYAATSHSQNLSWPWSCNLALRISCPAQWLNSTERKKSERDNLLADVWLPEEVHPLIISAVEPKKDPLQTSPPRSGELEDAF